MAHGTHDPVIAIDKAERSVKYLSDELNLKENIEWKTYRGLEHNLGRAEMKDFVEWLKKVLSE
jgi:predicted esterase